jgi:hypothetical protein
MTTYTCPQGRCQSVEAFEADHQCHRFTPKAARGTALKDGRPQRTLVGVASDQGVVDAAGETVLLAGLTIGSPTPLLVHHRGEYRLGSVRTWVERGAGDGSPILFFGGDVGYGEHEDAAWEQLLAGQLNGVSVGLSAVRREGAVLASAVLDEISLGPVVKCPTACVLLARELEAGTPLDPAEITAATKGWWAWRQSGLKDRPRARTRPAAEILGTAEATVLGEAQRDAEAAWRAGLVEMGFYKRGRTE